MTPNAQFTQADYRNRAIDILAQENDGVKREIYGGKLANELQLNTGSLIREIERRRSLLIKRDDTSGDTSPSSQVAQRRRTRVSGRTVSRELFILTLLTF